jgi:hypothetical protein
MRAFIIMRSLHQAKSLLVAHQGWCAGHYYYALSTPGKVSAGGSPGMVRWCAGGTSYYCTMSAVVSNSKLCAAGRKRERIITLFSSSSGLGLPVRVGPNFPFSQRQ